MFGLSLYKTKRSSLQNLNNQDQDLVFQQKRAQFASRTLGELTATKLKNGADIDAINHHRVPVHSEKTAADFSQQSNNTCSFRHDILFV